MLTPVTVTIAERLTLDATRRHAASGCSPIVQFWGGSGPPWPNNLQKTAAPSRHSAFNNAVKGTI